MDGFCSATACIPGCNSLQLSCHKFHDSQPESQTGPLSHQVRDQSEISARELSPMDFRVEMRWIDWETSLKDWKNQPEMSLLLGWVNFHKVLTPSRCHFPLGGIINYPFGMNETSNSTVSLSHLSPFEASIPVMLIFCRIIWHLIRFLLSLNGQLHGTS